MNLLEKIKSIRCFVLDVDGVLTDGSLLILDGGQMVRRMNIKDGYALQLAVKKGYKVVVISGGTSEAVRERLQRLGITDVFLKVEDKLAVLQLYQQKHALANDQLLFMGDDIPDYKVMQYVGLACCPADAAPEIRSISSYISSLKGGEGCVRDILEKVLKLQGAWDVDTSVASK